MIEILSPDQNQTRVVKKILSCLKQGTQLGWLIDPEEKSIFVYYPDQTPQAFDEPEQILPVPEFAKGVHLTLQQLFDWLMD